jgi:predicted ATP-grasp superfamily ATP-dependent carboligase
VLLLATDFITPYRVLRCAHAGGAEVYVLGNAGAWPLRWSRHCRRLFISDRIIHGERDVALALEINSLVHELGIDMVIPADAPSVRSLIACHEGIEAPCFPLPTLQQFDLLNDKWAFAQLCSSLAIRHPKTRLFADASAARHAIAGASASASSEGSAFPLIVKPLGRCAGSGICVLRGMDDLHRIDTINYRPILLQQFISGEDIGASVFATGGRIEAFVAHWLRDGVYTTFRDAGIYAAIGRIVARLHLNGVYNFDMIRTPDGAVFYLECNPRFFYKIDLSMLAGINFVEWGLPGLRPRNVGRPPPEGTVRSPKALLRTLMSWRCTRRDWALSRHQLSDPGPWLMEKLQLLR